VILVGFVRVLELSPSNDRDETPFDPCWVVDATGETAGRCKQRRHPEVRPAAQLRR
jgi:hypothetical protein